MRKFLAKYKRFALVMVFLSVVIISAINYALTPKKSLRIYQPNDVNPEMVDTTIQYIKKYHRVADFSFINQNGDTITQETFRDHIYIADFFFTTCLTICPIMTDHMLLLQKELIDDPQVLLLSHTVTPETDDVAQLHKYAAKKGVDARKWHLVTGDKKAIYEIARKSYLAAKDQPYNAYDLVHTENFVLVDTKGRIRGFYDGTDPEAIQTLLEDLDILKKEGH